MHGVRRLLILIAAAWPLGNAPAANASSEPTPCTAANSRRVTVDEIWSDEQTLRNRCVGVEGYRIGDVIFTDQSSLYRYATRRTTAADGIIGIPYPGGPESVGLSRGIYYGRLESCREAQRDFARLARNLARRRTDDTIMLIHHYGFCVGSAGPAVRVEHAEEAPASDLRRMTGDRFRERLGELISIDDRYPYRAILPLLVGVATEGCGADVDVGPIMAGGPPEGRDASMFIPDFEPVQRDQIRRWCESGTRQHALFTVAASSRASEPDANLDTIICLCLDGDCTGRWPVALIDTGWSTRRPYLCQRVILKPRTTSHDDEGRLTFASDYEYDFQNEWIVDELWQGWGFPEP